MILFVSSGGLLCSWVVADWVEDILGLIAQIRYTSSYACLCTFGPRGHGSNEAEVFTH